MKCNASWIMVTWDPDMNRQTDTRLKTFPANNFVAGCSKIALYLRVSPLDVEILSARFGGDGYIRYVEENYEALDVRTTQIAFNFSTELPDGLILWTGEVRVRSHCDDKDTVFSILVSSNIEVINGYRGTKCSCSHGNGTTKTQNCCRCHNMNKG